MNDERRQLVDGICSAARKAGEEIMAIYRSDFEVETKADDSPVTLADQIAEKIILDHLSEVTPSNPIVAEERVAAGIVPDISVGPFWLVDPLDGTREFINRNDEFTVNIALIENRNPSIGVVYAPARQQLFYASGPGQAFIVEGDGTPRRISVKSPDRDGLIVVASRSHRDTNTDEYLKQFKIKKLLSIGSSLKLCLLAAGEADLYPRLGRTMEWDIAAGHAVLACAGGTIQTLDGKRFLYGKPGFENEFFIARGAVS